MLFSHQRCSASVGLFTSCSVLLDRSWLSLFCTFYSPSTELNNIIHQPLNLNALPLFSAGLLSTHKLIEFQRCLHSLAAVVPLHAQRFAAIGRLQQLELKQDGLVQVSAHKRLVVEDGDADNWGVHYWMPWKPGGETRAELQRVTVEGKWSVVFSGAGMSREEPCCYTCG